jgi:hypothetical protein
LTAQVEYDSQDALGIGRTEFLLPVVSDSDWNSEKLKQGFWQGRYFLRADQFDASSAQLSIYYGDSKISSVTVKKGDTSRDINLAGLYCRAGLKATYEGLVSAGVVAQLKVDDEYLDVYEGSKFLNDKCTVGKIDVQNSSSLGNVSIRCSSDINGGSFTLKINGQTYSEGDRVKLKSGASVDNELISPPKLDPPLIDCRARVKNSKFAILLSSPANIRIPITIRRAPKKYSKHLSHLPILFIKFWA